MEFWNRGISLLVNKVQINFFCTDSDVYILFTPQAENEFTLYVWTMQAFADGY